MIPMADDLQREATDLLARLIRFKTVNPPGDEREAQEFLAGYLGDAGLECELLAADDARPNLIARLRGDSPGPTLCLLGHVDTVLADPSAWTHDPWSGEVVDGFVWGRGALDMKGQVAAEVAAAAALARGGWRSPRRWRSGAILSRALSPMRGMDACPATPSVVRLKRNTPFSAQQMP